MVSAVHTFRGAWITDAEFADLSPRNVFHRQLEPLDLDCTDRRDRHILFRKSFSCEDFERATVFLSADDYYKLYVNGAFVAQGPAPSYHFRYTYNTIDVRPYLRHGENVIAVHTLYHGLINRVFQSGDDRHGLILDLEIDGETILSSDASFKTHPHTGYTETGVCGYETQFLERYDSGAPEVGFEQPDFDDTAWAPARVCRFDDHTLTACDTRMLTFETVRPVATEVRGDRLFCDFGATYVGYLTAAATGKRGDSVTVRCGQELCDDGTVRFEMRANCRYEEQWCLADGESTLAPFDYKSFRYAEFLLPEGVRLSDVRLVARHAPFALAAKMRPDFENDEELRRIWDLCVHTQKYGVQEVIQDCMEREKGFYVGDGCYTALTNMILTGDDAMVRKLIDDAFASAFITDTLVTCLDCSFMQEIAEYPLILVYLVLWHYRLTGDGTYLAENFPKVTALLDAYRRDYEKECLLSDLDKWCVVEWPFNFQDGYDVDIAEGKICHEPHVALNAYYIEAIRTANKIASALGRAPYRDEAPLAEAFHAAFYDAEKHLFRDGAHTSHTSIIGNCFAFAFDLCPDDACRDNILAMLKERGVRAMSLFCTFPTLMGLVRNGRVDLLREALLDAGAWRRMLREGATTTFEGWGKDTKWNTSLFHLTMSYAAVFLSDTDLRTLFA